MFAVPSLIHQRRQGRLIGGRALLQDPKGLLVAGLSLQTLLSVIGAASGFQLGPCVLDIRRLGLGRYGEQPPHRRAQQPSYHLVGTRGGLGGGCATASRTLEAGRGVTSIRASGEGMGGNAGGGIMAAVDTARVSLAKNTRWLVAGSAAAVLLLRRDAVSISCIAGAIANAIMSKVLKRVLNQERPEGAAVSDPGMPSSHAMSLFFFASYLSSALLFWIQWPSAARAACVAGMWAFAVNSAAWRVTAGLHTREQVLVGSIVGSVDGMAWFWATDSRWDLVEALNKALVMSDLVAPAICVALIVGAVVVGSVERQVKKWLQ